MRVIGFHSTKGGVGKSTLSVLCAFWAGGREDGGAKRVVLVDSDPWGDSLAFQAQRMNLGLACPFVCVEGAKFNPATREVQGVDNPDLIIIDIPPRGVNAVGKLLGVCDLLVIPIRVGGTEDKRLEEMFADYEEGGFGKVPKLIILNEVASLSANLIIRIANKKMRQEKKVIDNLKDFAIQRNIPFICVSRSTTYQLLMGSAMSPWEHHRKPYIRPYQSPELFREMRGLFDALKI